MTTRLRRVVLYPVLIVAAVLFAGRQSRLKAAQAARVAAVLAFATAGHNGVIGATLWNTRDETLPPRHGRLAALALIEAAAASCPPLSDPAPTESLHFSDRLAALDASLPRGTRLVLISDFAWLADAHETLLARLAERCDVWAIQIVDAAERALPEIGAACFHDMASGQRVWLDTAQSTVRSAARAAFAEHLAMQAARLARAGVRRQQVDSEADDLVALLAHG